VIRTPIDEVQAHHSTLELFSHNIVLLPWGEQDLNLRRDNSNWFTASHLRPLGHHPKKNVRRGKQIWYGRLLGIEPRASNPQFNIFPLNYSRLDFTIKYPLPDSNWHFVTKVAFKATVSTISPSGLIIILYLEADSNCQNSDPKSDTSTNSVIQAGPTSPFASYRTRTDKLQILSLLCLPIPLKRRVFS
jgi:hypothetical protein